MEKLIEQVLGILKDNKQTYEFIDETGKVISLDHAVKNGIKVTPVDPKKSALDKLKAAGLDLTDSKKLAAMQELVGLISKSAKTASGNTAPSKRKSFSDAEKSQILKEFHESGQTKARFAKEKGINYQTFSLWLKR